MDESFGAGGFDASQIGGSGVQSETKAEGIVPLVIAQIKKAPDNFQLFGMAFGMVSIVGIVRNVEHSSTKITVTVEDHSGQIDAHLWLEDGDGSNMPALLLNTYVRVFGSIRNQGGTKALMIFKIDPLSSINELTTHLLEVLNARFLAEDFANNAGGGGGGSNTNTYQSTSTFNSNTGFTGGSDNGNSLGLTGKQLLIYKAVKENKDDQGISKQELHKKFSHIPLPELENIMENMTTEGHIYTSIDSDHWLPTDME
ncbi:replication protein A 32 kDa subunit [Sitodiplosis mosellana]|uniref:replication protein A 32 kDa subunit n=1 Tax=Sitodiplosis mosellana TaxID=263140 RepID=UPI0024447CA2|nr:replication protein A 32 kDa subunit [Sitodiplosis mosellana]